MNSLNRVSCIEITSLNIEQYWHQIMRICDQSVFVSLDFELSGLGDRTKLNCKYKSKPNITDIILLTSHLLSVMFDVNIRQIDSRYDSVLSVARTRSVLSCGLAFFSTTDVEMGASVATTTTTTTNVWQYNVNIFNLLCACEEHYTVEPETLRFLVSHGFDFNRQCMYGLPYHRGNDNYFEDYRKPSLRNLISKIIISQIPIVLHNGFIDLIFLYENFYCELPNDLQTFIADLTELFPNGIYDTKYIADFHQRLGRSYLEYLFYMRQRFNIERILKQQCYVNVEFPLCANSLMTDIEFRDLSTNLFANLDLDIDICNDYAYHGWCKQNNLCPKSHNIDYILNKKKKYNTKRMKNKIAKLNSINMEQVKPVVNCGDATTISSNATQQSIEAKQGVHKAGYDAFMTGYCFASFVSALLKPKPDTHHTHVRFNHKHLDLSQFVNNIYLTGKDQSLRITASSFAKSSLSHKNKFLKLIESKKDFNNM